MSLSLTTFNMLPCDLRNTLHLFSQVSDAVPGHRDFRVLCQDGKVLGLPQFDEHSQNVKRRSLG